MVDCMSESCIKDCKGFYQVRISLKSACMAYKIFLRNNTTLFNDLSQVVVDGIQIANYSACDAIFVRLVDVMGVEWVDKDKNDKNYDKYEITSIANIYKNICKNINVMTQFYCYII